MDKLRRIDHRRPYREGGQQKGYNTLVIATRLITRDLIEEEDQIRRIDNRRPDG